LQLVDLAQNEQEVRVDELPFPIGAEGIDKFPGEHRVLELPRQSWISTVLSIKGSREPP